MISNYITCTQQPWIHTYSHADIQTGLLTWKVASISDMGPFTMCSSESAQHRELHAKNFRSRQGETAGTTVALYMRTRPQMSSGHARWGGAPVPRQKRGHFSCILTCKTKLPLIKQLIPISTGHIETSQHRLSFSISKHLRHIRLCEIKESLASIVQFWDAGWGLNGRFQSSDGCFH